MAHKTAQIAILSAQKSTGLRTTSAREMQRTERLKNSLPEGISIRTWGDGRRKPYYVRFGPDKKVESFEFEGDRNDRAEKLAEIARTQGSQGLDYDPIEWRAYVDFKRQSGATLEELKKLWNAAHHLVKSTILTKDAVKRYLALRLAEDIREKSDTHRHIKKALDALLPALGELHLGKVTADMLRPILASLKDRKGKGEASSTTKRNYRKDWNTFFKRAVREKWIQENPCSMVIPPGVDDGDREILPIRSAFDLLKANLHQRVTPKLALEMFGFMRCSSVERVKKEHIRSHSRGIFMPGKITEDGETKRGHKSGKSKYRQGHLPVLWAWIDTATEATWEMSPSAYDDEKALAFARACVTNPGNILRASCISYFLAATKNFALAAYLAQHRHSTTTEIYEGVADEKDAMLWAQLTPENVALSWEEFLERTTHDQAPVSAAVSVESLLASHSNP